MKLTIVLLTCFCLNVHARTSAQEVTLKATNTSLKEVFKQLEKKTGYHFFYNDELLQNANNINIDVIHVSLDDALKVCFKNLPLEYTIVEKTIFVRKAALTNKVTSVAEPPANNISGKITDADGKPLSGATIKIKGTTKATQSDEQGSFSLSNVPDNAVLVITYIGYIAKEISINEKLDAIQLMPDNSNLNDVVVIGYGTRKRSDVTGAIAHADLNTMKEAPNTSFLQNLQGVSPGLNIGQVTTAGSDPSISIRGRNSISGTTSPLIVVDGIIYRGSLVDINPNDIASVDILKDASAAAVYGSQASNGVLQVTTKTGGSRIMTKPRIDYSSTFSIQQINNKKMLPGDAADFIRKIGDRFISESRTGPDLLEMNPNWDPSTHFPTSDLLKGYQDGVNTNWWDLLTNKNPLIQTHAVSISGRTPINNYFLSFGYTNQENVIKNDTYERLSVRANIDTKITSWMKVGMQSELSTNNYSGGAPSITDIIRLPPQIPYQDSAGNLIKIPYTYRNEPNPLLTSAQQDFEKRMTLIGNFFADINIPHIKGLNYRANFGNNFIFYRHFNYNSTGANFQGSAFKTYQTTYYLTFDNIVTYRRRFGLHDIDATLLYGLENNRADYTSTSAAVFPNGVLGYNRLDLGSASQLIVKNNPNQLSDEPNIKDPGTWKETSLYQMARVSYTYNDRYILTGTIRRDGFSGFSIANKYATFPSASFAWRMTKEKFMQSLSTINDLKLRLSYGTNGNRTVGRYQTLSQITSDLGNGYLFGDNAAPQLGQYISSLPNNNLKWETTTALNGGIDFSLFNNRLFGSIDVYFSKTRDLLYSINIPTINGFSSINVNIGKLQNAGQELSLTGIPVKTKHFTWQVTANFSRNRNKVVSILGLDANNDGKEDDLVASKIFIGKPFGVAYDYNITGMWQVADYSAGNIPAGFTYGEYKIEDLNKDGNITPNADRKILGYTDPSYRFSIANSFQYKSFEFKFFINSIQGGKNWYLGTPASPVPNPDNIYGSNLFNFDYWTPNNPNARYRQIGAYPTVLGETFSPYISRNFVRLQDVTLSYSMPQSLLGKSGITNLSFFVNAHNLLTLTNWDGWDPELALDSHPGLDIGGYPVLKNYSIGVNVSF